MCTGIRDYFSQTPARYYDIICLWLPGCTIDALHDFDKREIAGMSQNIAVYEFNSDWLK